MAQIHLLQFLLFLFHLLHTSSATTLPKNSVRPADFIETSCGSTEYPELCFQSLSVYATKIQQSPKQLAQTALIVSVASARSAKNYILGMMKAKGIKGRDIQAMKDCVDNMGDSVDRLSKSIKEFGQMGSRVKGRQNFMWHMSNVQTWVSAALTDENTCGDGFSGRGSDPQLKATIMNRVVKVAQVTSNALALVNQFADDKHH